jgi:tRNA threonylcarbamoyl adenosine modification protein YjeE
MALGRFLADEAATLLAGDDIAAALQPGDVVALHGDLGAGKTTLARAIIRALAGDRNLEVPSPTFTLVQPYEARFPVAHFDLYRLASPDELDELGFDDAAAGSVVLIEWPERAGNRLPAGAIHVQLTEEGSGRRLRLAAEGAALERLTRSFAIRDFLGTAGWGEARRSFLLGDASTRAYETVALDGSATRILMNAPRQPDGPPIRDGKPYSQIARLAETVTPFVAVGKALKGAGIAAPEIFSADLERGILLIEHLGDGGFLAADGTPVVERYRAAGELLADLHAVRWNPVLPVAPGIDYRVPAYDPEAMAIETELLIDWYMPHVRGAPATPEERRLFAGAWASVFSLLDTAEKSLVLRDYHSPNLIWRPQKTGRDRLGVIDFQDALIGPSAYDVASLAMDARVTISPELEAATVEAYCATRAVAGSFDRASFEAAYAIMAAQRNSKILGIFVRLNKRDGKPQYLKHLPRIRDYVSRALRHPALAPVREAYRALGIVGDRGG